MKIKIHNTAKTALTAASVCVLFTLTGCVQNTQTADSAQIAVTSNANECAVSHTTASSGPVAFTVTNSGSQVTEFYVLADDGLRIIGEIENIGPGVSRDLVLQAQPGNYFTVCKPGMIGEGVGKAPFTVTGEAFATTPTNTHIAEATANYISYVKNQVGQLVSATSTFVTAYLAHRDDEARSLYTSARANYERIETVAESFGDLDPQLDFRENDVTTTEEWTGWHRIEKDLWPPPSLATTYEPLSPEERSFYGSKLIEDTQKLYDAVHAPDYTLTIDAISNGAVGLMDEVAIKKITGEEEIWSHTDLWDFAANLEGARIIYDSVRPLIDSTHPELVTQLDTTFDTVHTQLSQYGTLEGGFLSYNKLSRDNVKQLADGVNALSEPLSALTSALLGN